MPETNSQNLTFPPKFIQKIKSIFPDPQTHQSILTSLTAKPTTLRLNSLKNPPKATLQSLKSQGFDLIPSEINPGLAFILQNKSQKELAQTQEYKQGHIYLQSLASQVPVLALDPKSDQVILDLTAAPGSKTSQIAAITNQQGKLHANDVNTIRLQKLQHNLKKLGINNPDYLEIHNLHGGDLCQKFPDRHFDKILLDAPCSGEARFNNQNPKSFHYWENHRAEEFHQRQSKLLTAAWPKLKPGGILVYSTCTFEPLENEAVIQNHLQNHPTTKIIPIHINGIQPLPALPNYHPQLQNTLRIKPDHNIESFFIAKLQKN
jgi:16S rRNA (cytosine1407-C5)-methyltransferase